MIVSTLDKLESRLLKHTAANDAVGVRDTIIRLCAELDIPSRGDPILVVREPGITALIDRCAQLVFLANQPELAALCAELIICAASQLIAADTPDRFSRLIRRALTLAEASENVSTLRRALNNSAVTSLQTGNLTLSLVHAARAYALSRKLGDTTGEISVICNAMGALQSLGLHRECLAFAKLAQSLVIADTTSATVRYAKAATLTNAAHSHVELQQYAAAAQAASQALLLLSTQSTAAEVWCATKR